MSPTDGTSCARTSPSIMRNRRGIRSRAHAWASCLRCHNDRGPVVSFAARGCGGCHPDPHTSSLGLDCERCHEQINWRPTGLIAEHARTRFPLFGAHAVAPCESCHPGAAAGQFRGAPVECDLCHRADLAHHLAGSRRQRMDDGLSALPHAARLGEGICASRLLPALRWACGTGLHPLPYERRPRANPFGLLLLSRRQLSDGARPCGSGLPPYLRAVPQHRRLDPGAIRPHGVSPDGRPRRPGLHSLSYKRQVRSPSLQLLFVSCDGLSGGAGPHVAWLPTDLPAMPHNNRVAPVHVSTYVPSVGLARSVVRGVSYHRQYEQLQLRGLPLGGRHERETRGRVRVQLQLAGVLSMSSYRATLRQV